jgi:tRNA U55 pseudouridine synthase TruB
VHGVLLLDKPLGGSSNQVLQKAKWLLRAEKAGHTGTLDPLGQRRAAPVLWRGNQIQPSPAGRG